MPDNNHNFFPCFLLEDQSLSIYSDSHRFSQTSSGWMVHMEPAFEWRSDLSRIHPLVAHQIISIRNCVLAEREPAFFFNGYVV